MSASAASDAAAAAPVRLGLGSRVAYGASAFGENLAINSINQLAFAVFNITLLVSPALVGVALALPRLLDLFLDPLVGGRLCAPIVGGTIAVLGIITVWKTPERAAAASAPAPRRVSLLESWRITLGRIDFVRLCLAQILIFASLLVIDNTGFYLNVFYVNGGSMSVGAWMKGWYGTAMQAGGMLAIPFIVRLSRRIGKKQTLLLCTALLGAGGIAKWFCYVPDAGWWLLLPSALMAPGLVAVLVLIPSMTADICDLDAAESGARREGMYNAVLAWAIKVALSGSIFLSGWVLSFTGWVTDLKQNQSAETFLTMRIVFAGGTVVFAGLAAWLIAGYRVTPESVAAAQARVANAAKFRSAPSPCPPPHPLAHCLCSATIRRVSFASLRPALWPGRRSAFRRARRVGRRQE